jgi:plasmid maintenance system killer protein
VKSIRTKKFRELFAQLPSDVQKQAINACHVFKANPYHPGLHFQCVNKEKSWYSVRVNKSYQAIGTWKDDTILWHFIGTHADYDSLL